MPTRETFELVRVEKRPSLMEKLRSYWSGPITSNSPEIARLFGSTPTNTGISVNEESALTSSPVWSAVTMIADDISSLPLHLYKYLSDGGKERFDSHPLYRLVHDQPNPEMSSMVLRRTLQTHLLLWQNAYAEIERDGGGRPIAIWPLVPESVSPIRENGILQYRVHNPSGGEVLIPAGDMLHLVGYSHDGSVGCSLVQKARESISMGLAAERFGGSFYGNGMTFGGVISYAGPKPPELSDKSYKETLETRHQGVQRAYRMLALYNGAKFEKVGVAPNEGQFNESRIFQIREIARWFKIPPHKLGDLADATYSNVEQMDAAYMSSCIRPWLVLWQQQLNLKLVSKLERNLQFIEHDTHGFLSVDAAGRAALYSSEFNVAAITPNEMRGYENRNPISGGDDAFVPLAVIPLSKVGKWWDLALEEKQATIEKLKQPPPTPAPISNPDDQQTIASQGRKIQELTDTNELLKSALEETRAAEAEQRGLAGRIQTAEADLQSERSGRRADSEIATGIIARLTTERDTAVAMAATATVERDQARTEAAGYQEQVTQWIAKHTAVVADLTEAEAARVHEAQRAEAADRDLAIAVNAQTSANETLMLIRAREVTRLANVIAAHRGIMAHTMSRMITREAENARRHKGTAQKLRAWMETFYDGHRDMIADNILPIVRAHLAWMQSDDDPEQVARGIADAHVSDSLKQLDAVVLVEDFHGNLERLLMRWESQRPDAEADAFVREGMLYVRSYQ